MEWPSHEPLCETMLGVYVILLHPVEFYDSFLYRGCVVAYKLKALEYQHTHIYLKK